MAPLSAYALLAATLSMATTGSAYCVIRQEATPTIPLNEVAAENTGATALPTPTGTPAHIALGLGFQNYTCTATGSANGTYVQTQTSDGALADLYDLGATLSPQNMDTLTSQALQHFEQCIALTQCNPNAPNLASNSFLGDCEICHTQAVISTTLFPLQKIGLHYFDATSGTQAPHFALDADAQYLIAKKVGDVKAPAGAYAGAADEGAVDWLYLIAVPGNNYTRGLSSVYRLETAGGAAPSSCSASDPAQLSVPYAAQYWFYS